VKIDYFKNIFKIIIKSVKKIKYSENNTAEIRRRFA